jgi:anaerobic selenocysteine-containing dehydrogenase
VDATASIELWRTERQEYRQLECSDIMTNAPAGVREPTIVEPLAGTKSDYQICSEIARRLGLGDAYTEGRTEHDWMGWAVDAYRKARYPGLPSAKDLDRRDDRRPEFGTEH